MRVVLELTLPEANHIHNHLTDNQILDAECSPGWYSGVKKHFVSRHERCLDKINKAVDYATRAAYTPPKNKSEK